MRKEVGTAKRMTQRGGREDKEKWVFQVHEEEIAQQGRKRFQERRGALETGGGKERGVGTGRGRYRGNKVRSWEVGKWQGRRKRDASVRPGSS